MDNNDNATNAQGMHHQAYEGVAAEPAGHPIA